MTHMRSSFKQVLSGRKLKGKTKEVALQECLNEVIEKINQSKINPNNVQKILHICLYMEQDKDKFFSTNFINNIIELNKNENFLFKKIFPRSIQKFLALFYISFESQTNKFVGQIKTYLDPKTLNLESFKPWLKIKLQLNETTYCNIIENHYIRDIFLDTNKKISLGKSQRNRISRIVVFGDSLSDAGLMYSTTLAKVLLKLNDLNKNIKIMHKTPHNRFTNGYVWCDVIPAYLHYMAENKHENRYYTYEDTLISKRSKESADRFLLNYAVGGATAGDYSLFKTISSCRIKTMIMGCILHCLDKQVKAHLNEYSQISNNLNIIWAGPNDLITLGWDSVTGIEWAQKGVFDSVKKLKEKGAKNFLLINMPDIYLSPKFQEATQKTRSHIASLVDKYNSSLEVKAAKENIKLFDIRQIIRDLAKNNFQWYEYEGFRYDINLTNTKDGIALVDEIKKNEKFMYFDELHPSSITHGLLGFVIAKYLLKNFEFEASKAPPLQRRNSCHI